MEELGPVVIVLVIQGLDPGRNRSMKNNNLGANYWRKLLSLTKKKKKNSSSFSDQKADSINYPDGFNWESLNSFCYSVTWLLYIRTSGVLYSSLIQGFKQKNKSKTSQPLRVLSHSVSTSFQSWVVWRKLWRFLALWWLFTESPWRLQFTKSETLLVGQAWAALITKIGLLIRTSTPAILLFSIITSSSTTWSKSRHRISRHAMQHSL